MNRVIRAATLFGLLVGLASGVPALDWGANINQVPLAILGQTTLYVESIKAKAWLTQPLFGADFKLEADGSFSATSTGGSWKAGTPTFDLTEVSLRGTTGLGGDAGVVEWDLGRRNVTDLSGGWVLGSRWDGASTTWLRGSQKVTVSLGYSGLLSKKTSRISASPADVADYTNPKVGIAPQRVYALSDLGWNELFWRQDVVFELLGDLDLRTGPDALHGVYSTVTLTGPLPLGWRQKLFGTGALRVSPSSRSVATIAGLELSATIPFMGSRLVFNGVGSQGWGSYGFQPVSGKGMAEVLSLSSSRAAALGADFSLKPFPKTSVGTKTSLLFRTSRDPVAAGGFKASSNDYWLGTEAGVYASWTPTSELSFGLNGGVFLPQSGAFEPSTIPTLLAVMTATLKL